MKLSALLPQTAQLRRLLQPRFLRALGVVGAGVLLAEANLLAARSFVRWDLSAEQRFTLSNATLDLLHAQKEPLEVISLLTRSDPASLEARHLLDAYRAASPLLRVRFVDPDRDVAAFRALEHEFDLGVEQSADGASVASAAFLVRHGERRWFVPQGQLVSRDDEGRVKNQMEARLTSALARVVEARRDVVCFVSGHGERSIEDLGPDGLGELSRALSQSNLDPRRVPLDVPDPERALAPCDVIAVVAPERPWPREHAELLARAYTRRSNLLLLLDPLVDARGQLGDSGLGAVASSLGVRLEAGFVIEHDPKSRLPQGMGEAFFADVEAHPVTRGLSTESQRLDARPVLIASQALALGDAAGNHVLLRSSPRSSLLSDLSAPGPAGALSSFVLAAALEQPQLEGAKQRPTPLGRAVVVGSSNVASADSFREPKLHANRSFVENAVAWLVERPSLVSVPERAEADEALSLSEASLGELLRYVLLYMPTTAGLLGLFVLLRRRSNEARSRQEAP